MSSSFPEPEHVAPTTLVKSEHVQEICQDGRDSDRIRPWAPPARSNSTSLLTQALAATKLEDQASNAPIVGSPAATQITTSISDPISLPSDNHNGLSDLGRSGDSAVDMATVMPVLAPSLLGPALSVGASPISSPMKLNSYDMHNINTLLQNHRDSLNRGRSRGTSLERTEREKKLPSLHKGSANSGDTGFDTPPAPPSPTGLNSITTTPPTDGVRARYRSWRDARSGTGSEKAWSIGGQGVDDAQEGQVEKSITEAMTGAEPNTRSRKASHGMRLFREGLPEDKTKKTDKKGRLSKSNSQRARDSNAADKDSADVSTPSIIEESSPELVRATDNEGDYFVMSKDKDATEPEIKEELRSMPAQLLAEIRDRHNLTPGAEKGSSFSRSIPVTESEKNKVSRAGSDSSLEKTAEVQSMTDVEDNGHEPSSPVKSGDDDDSGEEQVSSALFVPHKISHDSPKHERSGFNYNTILTGDGLRADDSDSNTQEWLEEHEVPSRIIERENLGDETQADLKIPIVKLKQPSPAVERGEPISEPRSILSKDRTAPFKDAIHTSIGEESGVTDNDEDDDVTPTGSLKKVQPVPKEPINMNEQQEKSKAPLEAIELIPYRHQVGGHTTMWRFSKRAVCKQLNNRENEFYEKVERFHPNLLKFLPRYIGVLNVTFEKQQRRKSNKKDGSDSGLERGDEVAMVETEKRAGEAASQFSDSKGTTDNGENRPRMISQSLHSYSVPIPTVTFADNRHIIPTSFLRPHPHLLDPQQRSKSDTSALAAARVGVNQSQPPLPESDFTFRPPLPENTAVSWGATSVNKRLRNQVFEETFLQQPIPIHRHKKPGSSHRSLPNRHGTTLRPSISESSLKKQRGEAAATVPEESMRRRAMKTAAERRTSGAGPSELPPAQPSEPDMSAAMLSDEGNVNTDEITGTSAPEHEIAHSQGTRPATRPRRYSSGGLRRKPNEVEDGRGNLKYFVEADDAGYKGDEEDVFTMDPEPSSTSLPSKSTSDSVNQTQDVQDKNGQGGQVSDVPTQPTAGTMLPAAPQEAPKLLDIPRPVNPTTARTQCDQRVEYFLLLEDLTAGMKRPCIMDLKMGTRQYGVEANEKKQISQRQKCKETTSQELGVRVCGLQVWDVKKQEYIFQDKYFGRDLKAGQQFQDALTRFLYDGIDYSSVLRHIPAILEKLSKLEVIIRGLAGYRFYAASLLMFYDGDNQLEEESDSTAGEKDVNDVRKKKEIDFKIADFANCITKEGLNISERPCPPRHPEQPDNGFLRGLRSLKRYFRAIQKDVRSREMGLRRTQEHDDDTDYEFIDEAEEDEGGISY